MKAKKLGQVKLKKGVIAAALGISGASFSRYIRNGCPVDSISRALEWQRRHIDPAQRFSAQQRRKANEVIPETGVLLKGLQSMTAEEVEMVRMPLETWDRLFRFLGMQDQDA